MAKLSLEQSPLGKNAQYVDEYDKTLLFPIPRAGNRQEININLSQLPFMGQDIWHAYEIGFLNNKGKPVVAAGEFRLPCESANLIESKSLKLYLNSLNNSKFEGLAALEACIAEDLTKAAKAPVEVKLFPVDAHEQDPNTQVITFDGENIDELDITCDTYTVEPNYLEPEKSEADDEIHEVLVSNLLKSNCLVTGQPDWGTVRISYTGQKISHSGLLRYLVSFRNHNEFHEQCVERIFNDVLQRCQPSKLTVQANYTRRGGLDICPFRTNCGESPIEGRLYRQ